MSVVSRYGARVMEPSLDPKVFNVNEVAVGVNLILLYGFG
ncbi:hypothetical protein CRE_26534 [Caenorhabditis remanei]|uniref:Uncharacterized protein n=1 Tax=Caenorhabditis remanei TaxID=31234 RepID=E3LR37_CAERE|nr:hypothetical protein CRE_26534 [Caenorhabditis remanei]